MNDKTNKSNNRIKARIELLSKTNEVLAAFHKLAGQMPDRVSSLDEMVEALEDAELVEDALTSLINLLEKAMA